MLSHLYAHLKALLAREPAAVAFGLSAALIPVLTLLLHWDSAQTAAASAILAALSTTIAAVKARPVSVPTFISGAVAIAEALAAFHVKIPAADLAMLTSVTSAVLGALLRASLTPVASLRGSGTR